MAKLEAYKNLVEKRKACSLCSGLCNPSAVDGGSYDSQHIGPWSLWQGYLDAPVVVVGQDWGDVSYFKKWAGKDQPSGNPTNKNLQHLLASIGIQIRGPREAQKQVIFLTNMILCLKTGGLQAPVEEHWFMNCSLGFFKPLVEIIKPRAVIALGKKVSECILGLYSIAYSKSNSFSNVVRRAPYHLTNCTALFPVYHCGAGSVNRNRSLLEQQTDWSKIGAWLTLASNLRRDCGQS